MITVAFDIKRLADSERYGMGNYGITRYTAELLRRFRETKKVRVAPVAFAGSRDASLAALETAVGRLEASLGIDIARTWRQTRSSPQLVKGLRALDGIPRARRLIAPVLRRIDRLVFEPMPFTSPSRWDIYHSPINELPPKRWCGSAIRVLSVMDVIHVLRPETRPGRFLSGTAPVQVALDSVDVTRDYIICISESTRKDVLSLLPIAEDRVCVTHLAATDSFERPARDEAIALLQKEGIVPGKFILALGQFDPRKNLTRLAKAFAVVKSHSRFAEYTLVLVAARSRRRRITGQMQGAGLHPSAFKVLVEINDRLLAGMLASAALFVYVPLLEGFGIPVVEAMKAGCPVLVSNTSSLPEAAGEAGLYVNPTSVDEIVRGIIEVLDNPPLQVSMKHKGKIQAESFSWDKTAARTLAFYERILEINRSHRSQSSDG